MSFVLPSLIGLLGPSAAAGGLTPIDIDTEANIRGYDAVVGQIAQASDNQDLYVFNGEHWQIFSND